MTTSEFSYEFDVLYNNVTSNQAPGLNAYEKSVFLTKAEKQLVQEYYNQRTDVQGGGVDGSPKRQIDFSTLIVSEELSTVNVGSLASYVYVDPRAIVFNKLVANPVCILNESFDLYGQRGGGSSVLLKSYIVVPLSYEEYHRLMMKPYKFPPKGTVWRLKNNGYTEIIGKDISSAPDSKYRIRYVRVPSPIIVESLSGLNVTIDNQTAVMGCELPEEMHHEILERAVTLAKIAWQGATMTQVAAAQK